MTYQTHTLFGFAISVLIIKILSVSKIIDLSFLIEGSIFNPNLIIFYLAAVIGALFPDVDHANSKAGKKLWFISRPLKLFGIKHRGLTHSLLGLVLFALATKQLVNLGWINLIVWLGLIIGYLSHLIADMFNVQGIPIFYPNQNRFKFNFNITTSSRQEHLTFLITLILLIIFVLIERNYINLNINYHNLPLLSKLDFF